MDQASMIMFGNRIISFNSISLTVIPYHIFAEALIDKKKESFSLIKGAMLLDLRMCMGARMCRSLESAARRSSRVQRLPGEAKQPDRQKMFLLLDEEVAFRAEFVIVSVSDGRAETFWSYLNNLKL